MVACLRKQRRLSVRVRFGGTYSMHCARSKTQMAIVVIREVIVVIFDVLIIKVFTVDKPIFLLYFKLKQQVVLFPGHDANLIHIKVRIINYPSFYLKGSVECGIGYRQSTVGVIYGGINITAFRY